MSQLIIATVTHTPILHNGKRYEVGHQIELSQAEFDRLAYYLQFLGEKSPLDDDDKIKQEAKQIADELEQQDQADSEKAESEKAEADTVKPKRTRSKA